MIKLIFDLTYLFLPFLCVGLLVYSARQYDDKNSRYFILPFALFGIKELIQYYIMTSFDLRSLFFLYSKSKEYNISMLPDELMFAMHVLDLFVVIVFAFYILRYFEYPKRLFIPFAVVNIAFVTLLVVFRGMGYEFDERILVRMFFLANLIVFIILLQKGYFEQGSNFVIDSKGFIIAAFIVIMPPLLWSGFQSQYIGQIIRIIFYLLSAMLILQLLEVNQKRVTDGISILQKEKNIIEKLLNSIGSALAANMDQKSILAMINQFSMDATSARAGAILLLNKKKNILTVEVVEGLYPPVQHVDEFISSKEKYLIDKFKSDPIPVGVSYLGKVVQNGTPLFIKDAMKDEEVIQSAKGVMDISSIIALPLIADNETLGVLSVLNKTTDAFFSDEDFLLAKALAEQVAVALNTVKLRNEYQEKLQQEKQVAIAAQIQQGLLPNVFPEYPQLEVFAVSKAAKGVSGDYFDLLDFNGKLSVVCADVAGKGVPAAMVMVKIQTALRLIVDSKSEPKSVVSAINVALAGQVAEDRYATLFFCMLDVHTGMLSYSNAGHGPMIVYRALTDSFELLDTEGLPVGITAETQYGQDETVLNSGDIAILYTDGITEAMNVRHDEYSIARVKEDIRSLKDVSAKEMSELLLERITKFVGEEPQHDDQTLFIFKMK